MVKLRGDALCRYCGKLEAEHEYTGEFKGVWCFLLGYCTIYKYVLTDTEAPQQRSNECLGHPGGCADSFGVCSTTCYRLGYPDPIDLNPVDLNSVDHPQHYGGDTTYEAIKVIEAWGLGFNLGNALKYICREASKGGTEDLRKAQWYLQREIARREADATRGGPMAPPISGS